MFNLLDITFREQGLADPYVVLNLSGIDPESEAPATILVLLCSWIEQTEKQGLSIYALAAQLTIELEFHAPQVALSSFRSPSFPDLRVHIVAAEEGGFSLSCETNTFSDMGMGPEVAARLAEELAASGEKEGTAPVDPLHGFQGRIKGFRTEVEKLSGVREFLRGKGPSRTN